MCGIQRMVKTGKSLSDIQWLNRHELSAFVFHDKIWGAVGAAEPNYKINGEIWSLEIPKDWIPKRNR
jgi:hypothetical protein